METAISIPVIVFLLSVLGGGMMWSLRMVSWQKDDWELQQELQSVLERIVEDASRAEYAKVTRLSGGDFLWLFYRHDLSGEKLEGAPDCTILYAKQDSEKYREGRMVVHSSSMPMTGDSILGRVNITEFRCRMETPHVLHIRLTGRSFLTKHEFSLETAVFMRGHE